MTVVTDVIARLRADTTDFSRGFATATAQVKALETAAARSEARVGRASSTMANATAIFGAAAQRNSDLYRASLGTMVTTSGSLAHAVRLVGGEMSDSYASAADAAEVSMRRSGAAHARSLRGLDALAGTTMALSAASDRMGGDFDRNAIKANKFGMAAQGIIGALKGIGIAGGVALAAGGAALGMFTMRGIQAAASFEQTTLAFESSFKAMGRSAEDARNYLTDLRDFAAKTPFELTGLLQSVRGLLAIQKTPEQILNTMLPAIGDMAAMMGVGEEAIGRVVIAFRQMAGMPRVISQDLMQITSALPGFNAKMSLVNDSILAMQGGFEKGNVQDFQKALESGAITGAMGVDALVRGMQKFPGAAGMMEKQAKTLTGVISTFKDEVNNALIDGFAPAIPAISNALIQLLPAVKNLTKGFASAMGPVVAQIVNDVAPAFVAMSKTIAPVLSSLISGLGPVLRALLPLVGTLGEAVGGILVGALRAIAPVLDALVPPVQQFLSVLAASLYPVIQALQPVLQDFAISLGQLLTSLIPLLPSFSQLLVASIQMLPSLTQLSIATAQLVTALMPLIDLFVQVVVLVTRFSPMAKLMSVQTQVLARIMSALASVINPLVTRLLPTLNRVLGIAYKVLMAAAAGVGELAGHIAGLSRVFGKAIDGVSSFASSTKRKISEAADSAKKAWGVLRNALPLPIKNAVGDIFRIVSDFARRLAGYMRDVGASVMGAFTDGFRSKFPTLFGAVGSLLNTVVQTFNEAEPAFGALGNNHAVAYQESFMREMNRFAGNPMVGKALEGLMSKKPTAGSKQAVPGVGGGGAAAEEGGGGGGSAAAEEERKKWFKTVEGFLKAMQTMVEGGRAGVKQFDDIFRRAKGIWPLLGLDTQEGIKSFKKRFADAFKDGILTKEEVARIVAVTRNQAKAVAQQVKEIVRQFDRFAELTLRAFDAETVRQSEEIRRRYTMDDIPVTLGKKSTTLDFGAAFEIGDSDFVNKLEGTITKLRDGLTSAVNGLFGSNGTVDMSLRGITSRFNTAMKAIEAARNAAIGEATRAREAEYADAQSRREALTPAEQAMADMNEQANVENLMRNKMDAEAALAAAQKIRSTARRNEAIQAAQRQLNEALRAIQMDALQKQAQEERKARESAYSDEITAADEKYNRAVEEADRLYTLAQEAAQREYDLQVAENKRMEEEAVRNAEFVRETERLQLENSLNDLRKSLEAKKVNWTKWKKDFGDLLTDQRFANAMEKAGTNLGSEFSAGLLKSKNKISSALEEIAKLVERYLKVKSPTDLGPMNDLNRWWKGFGDTLIDGFDERAFARKLGSAVAKIPANVDAGLNVMPRDDYMSIMPYPNGKTNGAPVTIQITVQGSVVQERDLAESIREELVKIGRRDGTIFGGIV